MKFEDIVQNQNIFHPGCVCWQYIVFSHSHPPNSTKNHQTRQVCDHSCLSYHQRLDQYCNRALLYSQPKVNDVFAVSEEGFLPVDMKDELELVQVHIVARHGDRSPGTPYTLGSPVFYDCGLVEDKATTTWSRLRDFPPLQGLRGTVYSLHQSIYPGFTSKQCGVGKLTSAGFHHHKALGTQMKKKYAQLLFKNSTGERIARSVFVQSTDFIRTIQSAAAFMLGFLPDQRELRKRVTIHVSPDDRLEAPPPDIEPVFKPCKHYSSFQKAELAKSDYFQIEKAKYHPVLERLCHMFGLHDVQNKPIVTKLFDSIATRGCHARDHPLPCYRGQCLDYDLANKLFEFSDWTFSNGCTQYGSVVGLIPFLRHSVLGLMEVVAREGRNSKRFILSLTHDTTMTPLMFALGIRLDSWMPYASRIAFELWRSKMPSKTGVFKVRVLFNGTPVTQQLAAWEGVQSPIRSAFLPYYLWKRYLEKGKYRDSQSYDRACGNLNS